MEIQAVVELVEQVLIVLPVQEVVQVVQADILVTQEQRLKISVI